MNPVRRRSDVSIHGHDYRAAGQIALMNVKIVTLSPQEQELANLIRQARADRNTLAGRDTAREVDLAGAYRIQVANRGERVLKGYKFGLISPAKQEQMGISTPLYGPIYADMLQTKSVSLNNFIAPRIEPEIALVLGQAVGPGASADAISQAISGYFIGADILDSVWENYKFTASEVVADNTSGGGFLLASQMSEKMGTGLLRLFINGELQTEGHTDELGSPTERLHWLTRQVGELTAGTIIFLGSPAASIPARAGMLEVTGPNDMRLTAHLLDQ